MGGQVWAVGKQLVIFGRTLRDGGISGQRPSRRQLEHRPGGQTEGGELVGSDALVKTVQLGVAQGLHPHRLPTRPGRDLAPSGGQFFVHKKGLAACAAEGRKGFIAHRRKTARLGLQTHHALPPRQRAVSGLDAQVLALVGKHGASLSAFKLGVLVIGVAQAGFDAVKPARQLAHLALQRIAGGLHANRHLVFGHGAVVALVGVDRCAQIAMVPEGAGPDGPTPGGAGRVADAPGVGR